MATSCGVPASSLSKAIWKAAPAGALRLVGSNAMFCAFRLTTVPVPPDAAALAGVDPLGAADALAPAEPPDGGGDDGGGGANVQPGDAVLVHAATPARTTRQGRTRAAMRTRRIE